MSTPIKLTANYKPQPFQVALTIRKRRKTKKEEKEKKQQQHTNACFNE